MNDFQDEESSEEIDSVALSGSKAGEQEDEDDEFYLQKLPKECQKQMIADMYGERNPKKKFYQNYRRVPPHYTYNQYYLANDELPPERSSLLFPTSREIYMYVENKQKLWQLINIEQKQYNVIIDIKVHETGSRNIASLLVVCVSCAHKLLMKFQLNKKMCQYRLAYFDNTHIHQNQKSLLLSRDFKYKLFLKELKIKRDKDRNMTIQELQKHLQKDYGINERQFRGFFYSMHERYDHEMTSLLKFLRMQEARIWACTQPHLPQLLELPQLNQQCGVTKDPQFFMLSLKYMYENCQQFSKILSINIVPGFIERKTFPARRWEVIAFSGLNYFTDLVPFAFAFLSEKDDSIDILTKIIRKFMKQFDVSPEVIITPYSEYYHQLMNNFKCQSKMNFLHIYDALCHIETIGEQLEDATNRTYFQDAILSTSKPQFAFRCEKLLRKVEPTKKTMEIFNKMVEIAPKMCFGLIQTHEFIGLTFRYSANKYILNLIKQIFIKETVRQASLQAQQPKFVRRKWQNNGPSLVKSVFLIVRAALRYNKDVIAGQKVRGGYCQWRSQGYLLLPEVENIRINIKRLFLDLIFKEYGKIFHLDAACRDLKDPSLKEMKTFDVYDRSLKSIFVVSAYPVYGANQQLLRIIWKCNCCYSLKCGLPCSHQIKIATITNTSIFDQIHQLWLKKRVFAENLKKRGRTKGTRRNTEK